MKVYTKGGDKGMTSLVGGERIKKYGTRIEAYGTVDELNSFLGQLTVRTEKDYPELFALMRVMQSKLFNIGSYLATDNPENKETKAYGLKEQDVEDIEKAIDKMDEVVPPFTNFILPGGSEYSALAHVCRTVARRCERRVVKLEDEVYVDPLVVKYLNRLSDFFFVLARFNNEMKKIPEFFWDKEC